MTKEEFESIVKEQKDKGMSEEDIAKAFAIMFKEGIVDREQLEALLGGLGYELTGELKELDDEQLKEKIVVESEEGLTKEEAKEGDEEGDPAPSDAGKEEEEEETEEKSEEKSGPDGEKDEEEEKKEAFKSFGL